MKMVVLRGAEAVNIVIRREKAKSLEIVFMNKWELMGIMGGMGEMGVDGNYAMRTGEAGEAAMTSLHTEQFFIWGRKIFGVPGGAF